MFQKINMLSAQAWRLEFESLERGVKLYTRMCACNSNIPVATGGVEAAVYWTLKGQLAWTMQLSNKQDPDLNKSEGKG